jgi:hypothetical protein
MRKIILLAVIIRLLLMPFYFHPDIKTYNFQASFLKKGVVNIYDYLLENKKDLPLKEEFVYFPLTYFSLGSYQALISPLLGSDFDNWLADAGGLAGERVGTSRYLFFLKLPYLAIDLAIAYLLTLFFKDKALQKKAVYFWLFNPFTLILFYVFSNIDILPVAISLLAIYFALQKKLVASALFLTLASGFKVYPLLFLPFLFLAARDRKEKIQVLLAPLLLLVVLVLPFWGTAFRQAAFVSGLTTRIFQGGFSLGFGEAIFPAVVLLVVFFFYTSYRKNFDFLSAYTILFLLIFSFTHFHIQWLAWITPFLVILVVKQKKLLPLVILMATLSFTIPFLYNDKSMSVSLFRGYSHLFDLVPIPFAILQKFYDPYNLESVLHSLLAGVGLIFIWRLFEEKLA